MRPAIAWVTIVGVAVLGSCMRTGFRGRPDQALSDARVERPSGDGAADLLADGPRADRTRDLVAERRDLVPDSVRDLAKPDLLKPDLLKPDLLKPDLPKPDLPRPPGAWVTIAKGSFLMGAPSTEPCSAPGETQHQVTLTHAFEISTTEVLQADFTKLLGYNPSGSTCGATCPAENLTWHEAASYCNALSTLLGLAHCYSCSGSGAAVTCANATSYAGGAIYACPGFRLPTEAEWEYAYRAGTTTGLYNGQITANCNQTDPKADLIAWYSTTSTHVSAQKQPNAWGLYDMAGNVWEWTNDLFQNDLGSTAATDPIGAATGTGRAYRGGSYFYGLRYLRAAYRASFNTGGRSIDVGFRCARSK